MASTDSRRAQGFVGICSAVAMALATAATAMAATNHGAAGALGNEVGNRFIQVRAKDKFARTQIADLGMSIEATRSDSVWGFASPSVLQRLREHGIEVMGDFDYRVGRGGHESSFGLDRDFPTDDAKFHNYREAKQFLDQIVAANPDLARVTSIGKSIEGRDLWALHLNSSADALETGKSNKPGAIFMGNHHAREHVSAEIPLMIIDYLVKNRNDAKIKALLEGRDLWFIPMVNPDGAEYDISTGSYRSWRKNRRNNGNGTFGVDLNRNYSFGWGTGGSSKDTSSDIYMGKEPFSEPETQAIRDFVRSQTNTRVLLTFHTYSELVLYPWGGKYDDIANAKDRAVFEQMAKTMAGWNHYTAEKSSDLYIASGDTTDWAYGELGIFAFTFELSPSSFWEGGFYPGQAILNKVFQDNLRPVLYMMELADDPYQATAGTGSTRWLKNYAEPTLPSQLMFEPHPLPLREF